MLYGSNFGTINFAWKLPKNETVNDYESNHAKPILTATQQLPAFHSWQIHEKFIDKYRNSTTASPSVLHCLYQDLTGDCSAPETTKQSTKQDEICKFFMEVDEPNLLLNLRTSNGNPSSMKVDEFWEEICVMFNKYQTAVHKHRHNPVSYLQFAISIRELIERVKKRSGILTPLQEWVYLQFSPINLCTNNAMKYIGHFEIKYTRQRRQM